MKKYVVTVAAVGICFAYSVKAQDLKSSQVPNAVLQALNKDYPEGQVVKWEKEKTMFEANWGGRSGEDMSVLYQPDGTFVQQVKAMSVAEVPKKIKNYIGDHWKHKKITE